MGNFFRLVYIEWLKNSSYKPVIVFGIIYFVILIGFGLICAQRIPFFGIEVGLIDQGFLEFPQLWNFMFYMAGLNKIFLGMIIMFTVTNEFTEKLFKQNLIDGLSKREYLLSKVYTILILSLVSTLVMYLTGLWLGYTYSTVTDSESINKEIYFAFGYFLKLVNFLLFFLLLTILLKRIVLVLLSFFALYVFELICRFIEYKFFSPKINDVEFYTDYFPLANMHYLVDYPFERINFIRQLAQSDYVFVVPWNHVWVSILYSFLFLYLAYRLLLKKDW